MRWLHVDLKPLGLMTLLVSVGCGSAEPSSDAQTDASLDASHDGNVFADGQPEATTGDTSADANASRDSTSMEASSDGGPLDGAPHDGNVDDSTLADASLPDAGGAVIHLSHSTGCDPSVRAGYVHVLSSDHGLLVDGIVETGINGLLGPARATSSVCSQHRAVRTCRPGPIGSVCSCPVTCNSGLMCGYEGTCVAPVSPRADITARVSVGTLIRSVTSANPTGRLESNFGNTATGTPIQIELTIPGQPRLQFDADLPAPFADPYRGVTYNDMEASGVNMTWTPASDGTRMHLHLRQNHHEQVGFAVCELPSSTASLLVPATIIDPLRPTTGFEGGDAIRGYFGSVTLDGLCYELAIGSWGSVAPNF